MQNKKQKRSQQKGLTLIGLLIGGAIIGITFTSGLTLISRNIRFSSVTAHEIAASALAEEGVELIRNIRDTGDNYCIKEDSCNTTGFDKINGGDEDETGDGDRDENYALDYTTDTYDDHDIPSNKVFDTTNAGLCINADGFYQTCSLSSSLKFIRKIYLLTGDPECKGVLVTVTVYWTEFWEEAGWPSSIDDPRIEEEDNAGLHKVQIHKCMYDWRPR